jgi:glycosyltransferase involved in cell wall biosynthesis
MNKKVLMIAYYYPPINNGGVQRPASFAKYLPSFGYEPIIVTCNMPGVVNDTKHLNAEKCILRFRDRGSDFISLGAAQSFLYRGARKVLYKVGLLPGYFHWWYKEVSKNVHSIVEEYKPDIVWSTYPPLENLMIGMDITRKYGIPLILDFRDGLVYESLDKQFFYLDARLKRIEEQLVSSAAKIVTVTDPITEYFNCHYPGKKAVTISNGFDRDEWQNLEKINLGDKINFAYTGRLTNSRKGTSIKQLVKAINLLSEDEKKKICFHMIGEFSNKEIKVMSNEVVFKIHGFVDRFTALQYQYSADILLLVTASGQRSVATGKLFEYLAAKKPIFALTGNTAAEEIIINTGIGICVDSLIPGRITQELRKIITEFPQVSFYKPVKQKIDSYDRRRLANHLANLMDDVIEGEKR